MQKDQVRGCLTWSVLVGMVERLTNGQFIREVDNLIYIADSLTA